MGRQKVDQSDLFYLFNLEGRIPAPHHLLRRINPVVTGFGLSFARSWNASRARSVGLLSTPSS
jgi:hypothetical protein